MKSEDDELEELTPQIPSQASRDYGVPFAEIFQRYEGDFYKIDPHLFSPAKVQIVNLNTGTTFRSGESRSDLLNRSFYG